MNHSLKISFCTTCMGRLSHLKETLPKNIANNADYENTEFVILDYGSKDGLAEWIKAEHADDIASGKIRYARFEADHFNMAHAKNMVHRLATGDVVCNLDADNITARGTARWLSKEFSANTDIYVRPGRRDLAWAETAKLAHKYTAKLAMEAKSVMGAVCEKTVTLVEPASVNGMFGRIAISRDNFMRLQGYEEKHHKGWGTDNKAIAADDENFDFSARAINLRCVHPPLNMMGNALHHPDEMRTRNLSPDVRQHSDEILKSSDTVSSASYLNKLKHHLKKIVRPQQLAPFTIIATNANGEFGCGKVVINFDKEMELLPVPPQDIGQGKPTRPLHSNNRNFVPGRL